MRKLLAILILACILSFFSACRFPDASPKMHIEKARLSEKEESVATLLGYSGDRIFDFQVDDSVQSIQINTLELKNGRWYKESIGSGFNYTEPKGRISLSVGKFAFAERIAIQGKDYFSAMEYNTQEISPKNNMAMTLSYLGNQMEVTYEKEIPLAIQVLSSDKNDRFFSDVSGFYNPQEYDKYNYEHVYAVTVLFSQKKLE